MEKVIHLFLVSESVPFKEDIRRLLRRHHRLFLTDERRQEMINMALKAAQAIQYQNAGTIECLVDEDGMFYFF